MADPFNSLHEFGWRLKSYPVSNCSHEFAHDQARHRMVFRASPNGGGEYVEQLGPQVLTARYTIPMREGIAKGPFSNLFSQGLLDLFYDMQDPSEDVLVDPFFGPLMMVPLRYSDNLDPNKRDGADVDLEFVIFNDLDEEAEIAGPSLEGLTSDAGRLDEEVEVAFREAQKPSPQPATDPLSAIAGLGAQLQRSRDRVTSSLANTSARLRKIETQIDELEDPLNGDLVREARRLQLDAIRLEEKSDPARIVRRTTTNTVTSLAELAAMYGTTVSELLKLNQSLAKSPIISPGTAILYYA